MLLAKKTAFITGASKGIGYGIADCLLAQGMCVAITARSEKNIEKALAQLKKKHTDAAVMGFVADVRDREAQQKAISKTIKNFSEIDLLVANAGVGHFAAIDEMTQTQWQETIDINLTGVFNTIKSGVTSFKKN